MMIVRWVIVWNVLMRGVSILFVLIDYERTVLVLTLVVTCIIYVHVFWDNQFQIEQAAKSYYDTYLLLEYPVHVSLVH